MSSVYGSPHRRGCHVDIPRGRDRERSLVDDGSQVEACLGEIAHDVEEPHVADPCFERALAALSPGAEAIDDTDGAAAA